MYRLQGSSNGGETGLGITLKVMGGDKISLFARSYFKQSVSARQDYSIPVLSLLDGLLGGGATAGAKRVTASGLNGVSGISSAVSGFINQSARNPGGSTFPRAALNWILFDEEFNVVEECMGFRLVSDDDVVESLVETDITMKKSGYLYVYCSNESNIPVFFDNLQVVHDRTRVLEETHYYPFGLVMSGISSKALAFGQPENKKKYNGIEYENSFDLNIGEAFYRSHDPQLGRWWQIDPRPTHQESPYSAMGNNPMRYADFLGDTAIVFGTDGKFLRFQDDGKKKFSGRMITSETTTTNADGSTTTVTKYNKFKLNDGKLVAQAVKNGVINKVEFVSAAKINAQIDRSGVHSAEAQKSPLTFAKNSGTAGGGMDYAVQGAKAGDLNKNTLYVAGGVGYDIADFGNFLWGRGIGELGIQLGTAQLGAQYNHIFNGRRGNDVTPLFDLGPGTYGKPGWFDASSDQQAIINGHSSSPRIIREAEAQLKRLEQEMKYGPKF